MIRVRREEGGKNYTNIVCKKFSKINQIYLKLSKDSILSSKQLNIKSWNKKTECGRTMGLVACPGIVLFSLFWVALSRDRSSHITNDPAEKPPW